MKRKQTSTRPNQLSQKFVICCSGVDILPCCRLKKTERGGRWTGEPAWGGDPERRPQTLPSRKLFIPTSQQEKAKTRETGKGKTGQVVGIFIAELTAPSTLLGGR